MTAKEMFEELNYKQSIREQNIYYHRLIRSSYLLSEPNAEKSIRFDFEKKKCFVNYSHNHTFGINAKLSKAIQKQIEELGWK
jgi:hypothetical protein